MIKKIIVAELRFLAEVYKIIDNYFRADVFLSTIQLEFLCSVASYLLKCYNLTDPSDSYLKAHSNKLNKNNRLNITFR